MKIKITIAALILAIAVLVFPIQASAVTAGELKEYCSGNLDDPTPLHSICVGYIAGWIDGSNGMGTRIKGKVIMVVFEDNTTPGQITRVFLRYMQEHPEYENKTAKSALIGAVIEAKLVKFIPVMEESQIQ